MGGCLAWNGEGLSELYVALRVMIFYDNDNLKAFILSVKRVCEIEWN